MVVVGALTFALGVADENVTAARVAMGCSGVFLLGATARTFGRLLRASKPGGRSRRIERERLSPLARHRSLRIELSVTKLSIIWVTVSAESRRVNPAGSAGARVWRRPSPAFAGYPARDGDPWVNPQTRENRGISKKR